MHPPSTERTLPERRAVKDALRSAGLSVRQSDALLRAGWSALVGEHAAELAELRDALASLRSAAVAVRPKGA